MKRKRLSEKIAAEVLKKIRKSEIKIGENISSHALLAKELHISLSSLREGLQILFDLGFLNTAHGSGTVFAEPSLLNFYSLIKDIDPNFKYSYKEILEVEKLFLKSIFLRDSIDTQILIKLRNEFEKSLKQTNYDSCIKLLKQLFSETCTIHNNLLKEFYNANTELLFDYIEKSNNYQNASYQILSILNKTISEPDSMVDHFIEILDLSVSFIEENSFFLCNSFSTGSIGGCFYNIGTDICELLNNHSSIEISPTVSEGGIDNIDLVESGEAFIGITQADVAWKAYHGEGVFNNALKKISPICELFEICLWTVVKKNSRFSKIEDFKGARIAIGTIGGDSSLLAKLVLSEYGFKPGDYTPYYLSISNALDSLESGEVDVVFYLDKIIEPEFKELVDKESVKFVNIDKDKVENIVNVHKFLTLGEVRDPNTSTLINSIKVQAILFTNNLVSEDIIYEVLSVMKKYSHEISYLNLKPINDNFDVPVHNGAIKYFNDSVIKH